MRLKLNHCIWQVMIRDHYTILTYVLEQLANSPLAKLPSPTLSRHLTYSDMPSRSICLDSGQTFLAWEALIGIIWGPSRSNDKAKVHLITK